MDGEDSGMAQRLRRQETGWRQKGEEGWGTLVDGAHVAAQRGEEAARLAAPQLDLLVERRRRKKTPIWHRYDGQVSKSETSGKRRRGELKGTWY